MTLYIKNKLLIILLRIQFKDKYFDLENFLIQNLKFKSSIYNFIYLFNYLFLSILAPPNSKSWSHYRDSVNKRIMKILN